MRSTRASSKATVTPTSPIDRSGGYWIVTSGSSSESRRYRSASTSRDARPHGGVHPQDHRVCSLARSPNRSGRSARARTSPVMVSRQRQCPRVVGRRVDVEEKRAVRVERFELVRAHLVSPHLLYRSAHLQRPRGDPALQYGYAGLPVTGAQRLITVAGAWDRHVYRGGWRAPAGTRETTRRQTACRRPAPAFETRPKRAGPHGRRPAVRRRAARPDAPVPLARA